MLAGSTIGLFGYGNIAKHIVSLLKGWNARFLIATRTTPADLPENAVLCDLEVAIEQSNAQVEVGWLPIVEADPLQMRQLFQNLISNALKFRRAGDRPMVSVSGKVLEVQEPLISGAVSGAQVCEIMIKDNGIGFDSKFAEQIFVVFQRLHGRSDYEGTGIGLANVQRILHRHGGEIWAEGRIDHGATFYFTFHGRADGEDGQ